MIVLVFFISLAVFCYYIGRKVGVDVGLAGAEAINCAIHR
jgi:hypothetical protein